MIKLRRTPSLLILDLLLIRHEVSLQQGQGLVPMGDAVLHVLVQLPIGLVEPVGHKDRVPAKVERTSRRDDCTSSTSYEDDGGLCGRQTQREHALRIGRLVGVGCQQVVQSLQAGLV